MTEREWNRKAARMYMQMKEELNSPYRRVREHANYVRWFFFRDGEMNFLNEMWLSRKESRQLPMSYTEYMLG